MTSDRPQFLYVIGSDAGPQKIGIASNVKSRLGGLQTSSHLRLALVSKEPIEPENARLAEARAHSLLAKSRLVGEWFSVSPEDAAAAVRQAIADVRDGWTRPGKVEALPQELMTPAAFAAALDALDLTQVQFARLTGMTNGTVSRWVRGVLPVPLWAERLLDAWAVAGVPDHPTDPA